MVMFIISRNPVDVFSFTSRHSICHRDLLGLENGQRFQCCSNAWRYIVLFLLFLDSDFQTQSPDNKQPPEVIDKTTRGVFWILNMYVLLFFDLKNIPSDFSIFTILIFEE